MKRPLRIGMIGLDTSHVTAFARLLMDVDDPHHIGGGQVVAAYPGGSDDFDLSANRVQGFTDTLRNEFGVDIVDSPEAVAERVDLLFIHSVDGRVHRDQFERVAPYGHPVFIDKPFSLSVEDAQAILDIARKSAIPVMSSSSLRYADPFVEALCDDSGGQIVAVDVWGPLDFVDSQPGYFWYGVHGFEMLIAAMGVGVQRVEVSRFGQAEIVGMQWGDGRCATYRGLRQGSGTFGAVIHREKSIQVVDVDQAKRPNYACLIDSILRSLPNGKSDVDADQMIEVVRAIEMANAARVLVPVEALEGVGSSCR